MECEKFDWKASQKCDGKLWDLIFQAKIVSCK